MFISAEAQQKTCSSVSYSGRSDRDRTYELGDLLLETELYKLHGRLAFAEQCWCRSGLADVVMVFKTDENYKIEDNEDYWKRFEEEILPAVSSRCGKIWRIEIRHHVEGFYFDYVGRLVEKENVDNFLKQESAQIAPLGSVKVIFAKDGTPKRLWSFKGSSIAGYRERIKTQTADFIVRQAEAKRQAEVKQQQMLAAKRPIHRTKAANVLKLLETPLAKNAPTTYDFSQYVKNKVLLSIYTGNFEPFTEKYEPEDAERIAMSFDLNNLNEVMKITRLRIAINMAFVAYHRAFEDNCSSNKDIPWDKARLRRPATITRNGLGIETGRTREENFEFSVREPFVNSFERAFIAINNPDGIGQLMSGVSSSEYERYKNDFQKFLAVEKCSSPAIRQFEVNLYLANEWLLPLQQLQQTNKLEKQMPQLDNQKPKPQTGKIKAKPALRIN